MPVSPVISIPKTVSSQVENICKARALKAFNLDPEKWGVNVQARPAPARARIAPHHAEQRGSEACSRRPAQQKPQRPALTSQQAAAPTAERSARVPSPCRRRLPPSLLQPHQNSYTQERRTVFPTDSSRPSVRPRVRSPTPAPRPTSPPTRPSCSRTTASWALTSPPAATSPTATTPVRTGGGHRRRRPLLSALFHHNYILSYPLRDCVIACLLGAALHIVARRLQAAARRSAQRQSSSSLCPTRSAPTPA